MDIGNILKTLRKKRNITISDLSSTTGLSSGFISNLERNQNSPSITNLQLICQALNVNIVDIFDSSEAIVTSIIKKDERKVIFTESNAQLKYESVTPKHSELNGMSVTIEANSQLSEVSWEHNSSEIGIVTKGEMEIHLKNKIYLLKEGDSIHIPKNTSHKYRNPSSEISESYWVSLNDYANNSGGEVSGSSLFKPFF